MCDYDAWFGMSELGYPKYEAEKEKVDQDKCMKDNRIRFVFQTEWTRIKTEE